MAKALIFDVGGTLINPYKKLRQRRYEKFLKEKGIEIDFKRFWERMTSTGNGTIDVGKFRDEKKFWQMVFDKWRIKVSDEDVEELRNAYLKPRRLYPDVEKLLRGWKRRYKIAIVSNAFAPWFYEAFNRLNLEKYFRIVVVSSEVGVAKPDKRIFKTALKRLKVKGGEAIYVGNDPLFDIEGAKRLKIKTVILARNKNTIEKLKRSRTKPDFVIFRLKQLEDVLNFSRKN